MSFTYTEAAAGGRRHRFTVSTSFMQDDRIETPVSGATQIAAARGDDGLELLSIGSDRRLHHFTRGGSRKWHRLPLPWKAAALAVVPRSGGGDKVFFADYEEAGRRETGAAGASVEKTVSVYELEHAGREPQRRRVGRFVTTDPRVYGVGTLSGVECRDGSSLLVTTLAAAPGGTLSSWVVLFGHGASTGLMSLADGKGVVADKAIVVPGERSVTRWPHLTFVLLRGGRVSVEWGARSGALLQSERVEVPELPGVLELEAVRDWRGHLKIFALDRGHRLHVLCQVGGGGATAPRFTSSWLRLDCTQRDGSRPALSRLRALARADGDLELYALDEDDRLWSISEKGTASERPPDSADAWGRLYDMGVHAAHAAVASPAGNLVEVFAVTRQNELLGLTRDRHENWRLEKIRWDAARSAKTRLDVYRTELEVRDRGDGAVAGVPMRICASERLPSIVNGSTHLIGPSEPVWAETNAFGRICVTFELVPREPVPSLSFQADFLGGGLLDVCPERKAQVYVRGARGEPSRGAASPGDELYLIPEDTLIDQL